MKKIKKIIKQCKNLEKHYKKKVIRRLKDMKSTYQNQKEVKKILKKTNPIIYRVYIKQVNGLNCGLTVINKGVIGKEYYMTKGHKHIKPSKEWYILQQGKGKQIIQNKTAKAIELKKNKITIVPKNYAHRLANIGNKKLKVLTIYDPECGHNYNVKFKKRLFKE